MTTQINKDNRSKVFEADFVLNLKRQHFDTCQSFDTCHFFFVGNNFERLKNHGRLNSASSVAQKIV